MSDDPIIDEVRAARESLAEEYDHDLEKIVEALRRTPLPGGSRLVAFPPKTISPSPRPRPVGS